MTKKERLMIEFDAAIYAVLGENSKKEFNNNITKEEIEEIARKVEWYLNVQR